MTNLDLTDRQREILLRTLEIYISTGAPVGSHVLVDKIDASSSTIRAELSHLESVGLLDHPHTSAGRVPTDRGYRYYVDELLEGGNLPATAPRVKLDLIRREVDDAMRTTTEQLPPPGSGRRSERPRRVARPRRLPADGRQQTSARGVDAERGVCERRDLAPHTRG